MIETSRTGKQREQKLEKTEQKIQGLWTKGCNVCNGNTKRRKKGTGETFETMTEFPQVNVRRQTIDSASSDKCQKKYAYSYHF